MCGKSNKYSPEITPPVLNYVKNTPLGRTKKKVTQKEVTEKVFIFQLAMYYN